MALPYDDPRKKPTGATGGRPPETGRGAFGSTLNGGAAPGTRKSMSNSAPGMNPSNGVNGRSSPTMQPGQGINWANVSGVPQGIQSMKDAYAKGGAAYMVGSELTRGANQFKNSFVQATGPGTRYAINAVEDFGRGIFGMDPRAATGQPAPQPGPGPSAPVSPPQPWAAFRQPADGTTQVGMLEQQTAGFGTAADMVNQQNVDMQPDMTGPQLPFGVSRVPGQEGGVFVNNTPPAEFGKAIYSDSAAGATQRGFGSGSAVQALGPDGKPIFTPFGRTPEEQQAIDERVAQFEAATAKIRAMRGGNVPTERDRVQAQANQNVSLNQGLNSFLNQAAQRNYARTRLKELDANAVADKKDSLEQAKLMNEATQQGFENAIAQQNAGKGVFNSTKVSALDENNMETEQVVITDTRTGETKVVEQPKQTKTMSIQDATKQAQAEASEMGGGIGNLFTSEKDIFTDRQGKGITKADWITLRAQELSGAGAPPEAANKPSGGQVRRDPNTGEIAQQQEDGSWKIVGGGAASGGF